MGQFEFSLEPVIQFMAWLPPAFQKDLKRPGTDLLVRWTVCFHCITRHQRDSMYGTATWMQSEEGTIQARTESYASLEDEERSITTNSRGVQVANCIEMRSPATHCSLGGVTGESFRSLGNVMAASTSSSTALTSSGVESTNGGKLRQ